MKKLSHYPLKILPPLSEWILQKKQDGFTIVELMIVMAIIALLSTMGVIGYTWFIKGTRDTQRMADIATLDSIILDFRRSTGRYPTSREEFNNVVAAANAGQPVVDPLDKKVSCFTTSVNNSPDYCGYLYYSCDGGEGYVLSAKFETLYNAQKYTKISNESAWYYNAGSCSVLDLPPVESVPAPEGCRTKADCIPNSVCVGPPPKICRLKSNQGIGSDCDHDDECLSNKCKKKVCEA